MDMAARIRRAIYDSAKDFIDFFEQRGQFAAVRDTDVQLTVDRSLNVRFTAPSGETVCRTVRTDSLSAALQDMNRPLRAGRNGQSALERAADTILRGALAGLESLLQ